MIHATGESEPGNRVTLENEAAIRLPLSICSKLTSELAIHVIVGRAWKSATPFRVRMNYADGYHTHCRMMKSPSRVLIEKSRESDLAIHIAWTRPEAAYIAER